MRTKQNSGHSGSYSHGAVAPCSTAYLADPIVALCRQHGARRVLDLGCGNGSLWPANGMRTMSPCGKVGTSNSGPRRRLQDFSIRLDSK